MFLIGPTHIRKNNDKRIQKGPFWNAKGSCGDLVKYWK